MGLKDNEKTLIFSLNDEKEDDTKRILLEVCKAMEEKGYESIEHLVHYVLTDEPTYITNYKNARSLIRKIDRYELLITMFKIYLDME